MKSFSTMRNRLTERNVPVVFSFEEATGLPLVVVLIEEQRRFSLYVVGTLAGKFGEYVSWSVDEFEEDPILPFAVAYALERIFSKEQPVQAITTYLPVTFTAFEKVESA